MCDSAVVTESCIKEERPGVVGSGHSREVVGVLSAQEDKAQSSPLLSTGAACMVRRQL